MARVLRIALDLLAQTRHVHVQIVILVAVLRPPHLFQQARIGDDAIDVTDQHFEERELGRREAHLLSLDEAGTSLRSTTRSPAVKTRSPAAPRPLWRSATRTRATSSST